MGALDGMKILDFSTLLPGPYASLMLADLGAEVLSVVNPKGRDLVTQWGSTIPGEEIKGAAAWLGRNKRSVYMDLKEPLAIEAVKRLVKDYDIVLEQFRPGVMGRLGLGYEDLKKENAALIYCSLTGYGQVGPLSDRAGHDINYLAQSGILGAAGRKTSGPVLYDFQIADVAAGAKDAVIGILSAAFHRLQTGEGQYIDISMSDGLIPFHTMDGADYLAGGAIPQREGGVLNGGGIYDFYETKDGQYMSVGSLEPKFFAALCDGLGYPEWRDGKCLRDQGKEVKAAFRESFLQRTREEWTKIFEKLDACVEPVLSLEEAAASPHLTERGMWPEVNLPGKEKTVKQPGCPIHLSNTPPLYHHAGYPAGAQTGEVLSSLGYDEEEIKKISAQG